MADFRADQAAGLRRLLGGRGLQAITFIAGCEGVGKSIAVANIAAELTRHGKEVLVVDETSSSDNVASLYGMSSDYDLLHVVEGRANLEQVLVQPLAGLRILQTKLALRKLGRLSNSQQLELLQAVAKLDHPVDVILVDAVASHSQDFSPFGLASNETVVVVSGNTSSITQAYSLIKGISSTYARKHYRILVSKVKNPADAEAIFKNIAQVSAGKGIALLDYVGSIPLDENVKTAVSLSRPVVFQAPKCAAANVFREIAVDIMRWTGSDQVHGGVAQYMQQLLSFSQRVIPNSYRI